MSDASATLEVTPVHLPDTRECTRCDGEQHLLGEFQGMGKYVCDICKMRVGFDSTSSPTEFLLFRGQPAQYTKKIFGISLSKGEQRL